jgi:tetratricopeptide (TPR) repeat protein
MTGGRSHRYNFNPRPDPLDRALEAARRAVDLDPSSQTARGALAGTHFFRHQLDPFKAEAERALALNPNHSVVLASVGTALSYAGDERGIALVRKAMELDPFHPTAFNIVIAEHHFEKIEYEEALLAARKVDQPGHFYTPAVLAAIYAELGRQSEARSAMDELLKLWPGVNTEQWRTQLRKWNYPDQRIQHMVAALRKAGLPE